MKCFIFFAASAAAASNRVMLFMAIVLAMAITTGEAGIRDIEGKKNNDVEAKNIGSNRWLQGKPK
jgi:hypothetical protein